MRKALIALAILLAGAAPAAAVQRGGAARQPRLTTSTNWEHLVVATPDGGFRMGNPNAAVRVIEYASITCPHCRAFSMEGSAGMRERVRTGRVSWEIRPIIIFPSDPGIFLLLKCQGARQFFDTADRLWALQDQWAPRMGERQAQWENAPARQRVGAIVRAGEIDRFFQQRGMNAQRITACLANDGALNQLTANSQRYTERENVSRTPTFAINGQIVEAATWGGLQPLLDAALRR